MEDKEPTITEKKSALQKQKRGLTTNRELAGLVILLLAYYIWKSIKENSAAWWVFVLLGLLIICTIGVIIYDTFRLKEIGKEIQKLSQEND